MFKSMQSHRRWRLIGVLALMLALVGLAASPASAEGTGTYRNPLPVEIPGDGMVESCADPSTFYDTASARWYTYCTADPLNDEDRNDGGGFKFRLIPVLSSEDLVNWTYEGDAFDSRPEYATATAGLWAPEIEYYPDAASGKYHLYYTVTETTLPGGGSAIGVATSDSPVGPWTHSAVPVVEPHGADCCGSGSRRWVYDPEVLQTEQGDYIYYGSYFGGISVRELSEDGLTSDMETQENVAVANKYEGAEVVQKGKYYYLFVSATNCCAGPLTGYSVFVGRSTSPTGPFLDRSGVDLNDNEWPEDLTNGRVGGTVALSMNGNGWVGPGHNTVFQDFDGQWWTIYHAINEDEPYFEGGVDIFPGGGDLSKRPMLLDPIDWVDGWPTVRGGQWISDTPEKAPAAQPGDESKYKTKLVEQDVPGQRIDDLSDDFNGAALGSQWDWVRGESASYEVVGGALRFQVQAADLFEDSDNASVLLEDAPSGAYLVETKVRVNVLDEGCCFNYVQGGLAIYGDDDNYVRLVSVSIWNTRQTEFGKELFPVQPGYPRYGNTVVGPPGEWTYLRIVKRNQGGEESYTAYTSNNGEVWERGGTWTHDLGNNARIGLVSMGIAPPEAGGPPPGAVFTAEFDYLRVYKARH